MKKRVLIIVALVLVCLGFIVSRPPHKWSSVTAGMSRQDVYAKLGQPYSIEKEKGFVFWQKDLLIGRWKFAVGFRYDDTVANFECFWKWNWW